MAQSHNGAILWILDNFVGFGQYLGFWVLGFCGFCGLCGFLNFWDLGFMDLGYKNKIGTGQFNLSCPNLWD